MRTLARVLALALPLALAAGPATATITIINMDGANEGFNDPTPAAPVGGNPGTTIGQQRLNVFNHAAQIWDALLQSPVTIYIQASFDPLSCTATSGVLGSAGPNTVESDFGAAGIFPATWYVTAEANRLTGTDLEPGTADITAQFNSSVGTSTCLSSYSWYYGYDDNEGANGIDLLVVLLHEFGHGLGFLTTTSASTGGYLASQPSVFDYFLQDDVSGKHWYQMTAAERTASAINTGHLVWDGSSVTAAVPRMLEHRPHAAFSGALTADDIVGQATFGAPLTLTGVTGDVVLANDGVGTTSDGCESPWVNAASVAGKVALVDRGTCTFTQKATNAQAAGAIALLVVNNVAGDPPAMSGTAPGVTIPVASLSQSDGTAVKTALGSGTVHVTIGLDPAHYAGADDAGKLRMYAPNPVQPGSSVSHWDTPAFPNLLMEPAINPDLTAQVDMTYEAFNDIGWFPQLAAAPAPQAGGPLAFSLAPNPVRDGGTLRFTLPAAGRVRLVLFDVAGRRVASLADGTLPAGEHAVAWARHDDAGRRVAPGVYLARLTTDAGVRTLNLGLVE